MSERDRWVPPTAVETPERGAPPLGTPEDGEQLEEREDELEELPEDDEELEVELPEDEEPVPPSSERQARLAAARALAPAGAHWAAVWMAGRDAAVNALESGASIASVYALTPPEEAGCRDCWMRGRDAALRLIQGV